MYSLNISKNKLFNSLLRLLACLTMLFAWPVYSSDDIDWLACATTQTIKIPVGVAVAPGSIFIGSDGDSSGPLNWSFDAAPSASGGVSCSGTNPVICSGISITLPAPGVAGSSVDISGTATASGEVTMDLEVFDVDASTACLGFFNLIFTPGFQMELVLDRSGSMNSSTNVTPPATNRWDALETSINDMSTLIFQEGVITASDDTTILQASEIGVSLFDTTYVLNTPLFPDVLSSIDSSLPADLSTLLGAQTPGGWTAMGQGVENAIARLTSVTANRVILLFTDGEQNRSIFVDENGNFLNDTATDLASLIECTMPGPGCVAIDSDIKIVTVGIGQPSGSYLTTLQNLATEHGGQYIVTTNGDDFDGMLGNLETTFDAVIAPLLDANSPQLVAFNRTELSGETSITLPEFKLNKRLGGLMFRVSLNRKFEIPDLVKILAGMKIEKDGVNITAYFKPKFVGNYVNSFYLLTDFEGVNGGGPRINSDGSYSLSIAKTNDTRDIIIKVATLADDHLLDIDYRFTPKTPKVMEDLKLNMLLNWRGKPLDTATVKAIIDAPGVDMNDLLANSGNNIDPSGALDAGTAGYQKYLNLIENDPEFLAKLLPTEQLVTLSSQGNGAYQATYNPGNISGVYQILYIVSDDTADSGAIQRLAVQSIYVRFGDLDEAGSDINTTVQGNTTTIAFKPISNVGKLIGPGQQNAFSFQGTDLKITNITDNQDGSYVYVITGDPNQQVTIKLLGDSIYEGALGKFGKRSDNGNGTMSDLNLFIWILLALVVLILLFWLIKKSTST